MDVITSLRYYHRDIRELQIAICKNQESIVSLIRSLPNCKPQFDLAKNALGSANEYLENTLRKIEASIANELK
jgi:hypothetical protein